MFDALLCETYDMTLADHNIYCKSLVAIHRLAEPGTKSVIINLMLLTQYKHLHLYLEIM